MALLGADLLMYPTAIGTEPIRPEVDTSAPWRRVMVGHAVANTIPVVASNRVGDEHGQRYYGTSFICDGRGDILTEMNRVDEGFAIAEIDLGKWHQEREWMALMRDRRPEMYAALAQAVKNG